GGGASGFVCLPGGYNYSVQDFGNFPALVRISDTRQISATVYGATGSETRAQRWDSGVWLDLGAGPYSFGAGMNSHGQVAVSRQEVYGGAIYPLLWSSETGLTQLSTKQGLAAAINDRTEVAGWEYAGNGSQPFYWAQSSGRIL